MRFSRFRLQCDNRSCSERRRVWRTILNPYPGVMLHGQWLCSPECLEQVMNGLVERLMANAPAEQVNKTHRFPLGLLMLSLGFIGNESLQKALHAQREAGKGRVGEWLREQGVVTEPQVTRALAMQWALPVYPLDKLDQHLDWARLVPLGLLESYRMLPVHCAPDSGLLHVAFSNKVDYTVLNSIEQMLDCRTEPCIAQQSQIDSFLERLRQESCSTDVASEEPVEPSSVSRVALRYVLKFGAREVRIVGCGQNIWARLYTPDGARDLLFRCSVGNANPTLDDLIMPQK